ncbi:MAG: DUF357 domain-containing protein [Halolamina sp.]
MPADLAAKTDRYGEMLAEALDQAEPVTPPGTPLGEAAAETFEMAHSYLDDGRHFRAEGDPVNALASFSYGYGWLDAGVRFGLFDVPPESELFTTEQDVENETAAREDPLSGE